MTQINFRVRAYIFGLGPKLIGPFTTLLEMLPRGAGPGAFATKTVDWSWIRGYVIGHFILYRIDVRITIQLDI